MDFQRARTQTQIASRQDEIIIACDTIYREKGYEAVHFKSLSEMTSISRPTIYNYYKTKEEVFLDILARDYLKWANELKAHYEITSKMTQEEFCAFLASTLTGHEIYLELLTVYINPIEQNSSLEKLCKFKADIKPFFEALTEGLEKYFPDMSIESKNKFVFYFMVVIDGVYPLTHLSEKQTVAMKNLMSDYTTPDFWQTCYEALLIFISNL